MTSAATRRGVLDPTDPRGAADLDTWVTRTRQPRPEELR